MTHSKSLILSLTHPTWKTLKPVLFIIVNCAPGPYSQFLSEFPEFLSTLVISTDEIIVGDFNIHADIDSDTTALPLSRL